MSGPLFARLCLGALLLAAGCARVVAPPPVGDLDAEVPASAGPGGGDSEPAAPSDAADPHAAALPEATAATASATGSASATAAPSAATTATHGAPSASPSSSAPASEGRPTTLEIGEPKFQNGEAPKAKAALDRLQRKLTACVNDNGGLVGENGEVELQFLVRAAGLAEGASVLSAKGITKEAKRCLVDAVQRKSVGTPTSDPVGVTVILTLKRAS